MRRWHRVVMIEGDGISRELCRAVRDVITATGAPIEWVIAHESEGACAQDGSTLLSDEAIARLRQHRIGISGLIMTPTGGEGGVHDALRKALEPSFTLVIVHEDAENPPPRDDQVVLFEAARVQADLTALLRSVVMMLGHLDVRYHYAGFGSIARNLRAAIAAVVRRGELVTPDIWRRGKAAGWRGPVSTQEMAAEIVRVYEEFAYRPFDS